MSRAARKRKPHILRAQIQLLEAILLDPDRTATTDACGDDLSAERESGGKWVGSVPTTLAHDGLIGRVGYQPSLRASRHATPVSLWRSVVADAVLRQYRDALISLLAALPAHAPAPAGPRSLTPSRQPSLFGAEPDRLPD